MTDFPVHVTASNADGTVSADTIITTSTGSVDGTRVPPAAQLTDNFNNIWTIGSGNQIVKNNTQTGGQGTIITWCGGRIRVWGLDNQWWLWSETVPNWTAVGTVDPCPAPPPPPPPQGGTFFVSAIGNDTNAGTQAAPWKTMAKVNASAFLPGSQISFRGGDNFTGQLNISPVNVPSKGNKANPIVIGSYGTGKATILANAGGANSGSIGPRSWGVMLDAVSGLVLQNLIITNTSTTQYGVCIQNSVAGNVADTVTVQRCDISGFKCTADGDFSAQIGVFGFAITNGNNGPINNLSLLDNELHGRDGPTSADDAGISGFGYGQNINNIKYNGNDVHDLGGRAGQGGDGILCQGVDGGEVAYNRVHDCAGNSQACGGPVGSWGFRANNVNFHDNEVYHMRHVGGPWNGACDKAAFDCDGGVTNCIYEYNYSHDNDGPAVIMFQAETPWGNNVYRYNISENDCQSQSNGGGAIALVCWAGPTQIYNNIVYHGQSAIDSISTMPPTAICSDFVDSVPPAGSVVANNIFIIPGHDQYGRYSYVQLSEGANADFSHVAFKNNIYWGAGAAGKWNDHGEYSSLAAWQATGKDAGSLVADPKVAAPGTVGTAVWFPTDHIGPRQDSRLANAYKLLSGSPALGAGIDLTAAPFNLNIGTRDFFGNPVSRNIGADAGSHP